MAKSKAQRMREYRDRKKQALGDKWLKAERQRVKGYYKPMSELGDADQEAKREQNRIRQARFRRKRKAKIQQSLNDVQPQRENREDAQTDENGVSSTSHSIMTVKLPFPSSSKSSSGKKRVSRALSKSYRRIETLEDRNEKLQRKLKTAQKKIERYEAKKRLSNTPKSKTDNLLRSAGLNPEKVPEIRKQLIFGECISAEIQAAKTAQEGSSKKTEIVHRVASGKIIEKYRMKAKLEKMTKLNRRKISSNKNVLSEKKTRLVEFRKRIVTEIVRFLERDDNSRQLPGKADAIKSNQNQEKKQKRVLNDYLYNLHLKFLAESPVRISRASFYRARPAHISLVNFASRSVCLCSKHQNFCFLLRALKSVNVTTCTNPDKFIEMYKDSPESLKKLLDNIPDSYEEIRFQQWRRVKLKNGKERQRVVEVLKSRKEFSEIMIETFGMFKSHIERVKQQYGSVKDMKEKLPQGQVIIQMDFSENYTCNTLEEIQSAYWNSSMVTLHPVVIYHRDETNDLKHTSYVYVSEVLSHNAAMVISIVTKILNAVKQIVPELNSVHFWTDSPSSQYRNKTIFDLIGNFQKRFGVAASWHFFESGHGKGPCDGIGGTAKRNADNAVKQGKALIQDATDFFAWATENEQGIKYELITEEEYILTKAEVDKRNSEIKPVKGSMALHAVIGKEDGKIAIRNTSCACDSCFQGSFNTSSECGWQICSVTEKTCPKHINSESRENNENEIETEKTRKELQEKEIPEGSRYGLEYAVDQFVISKYDGRLYVGKIVNVCSSDRTLHVTFMSDCGKLKGHFKWPMNEDIIWVHENDIVLTIDPPKPTSKTGRIFSFPDDILQLLENTPQT